MESYIIVGGGLAGLTAANALAGPGRKVTVIEQSKSLGGRAITHQDAGFSLNFGPHALYNGGPAFRTFTEWKIRFEGHKPVIGNGNLVFDRRKYPLIANVSSLLKSSLFSLAEKIEVANLLRLFSAGRAPRQTMRSWIEDHARSPKVRALASAITRVATYCADHEHLSASAALAQIARAFSKGVLYLDHGWQTLVDGLAQRARSLGVEIRCGEPVDSLDDLRATGIILALPPSSVEKMTGMDFPNVRPVRAACLDLGLDSLPGNAATVGFGMDRALYYSVHSKSAKLAPEGRVLIQLAKYLTADANPAADRSELENFADLLSPGWRDRVVMSRFLPSMVVTYALPSIEGRPAVDALNKPGVFLAGDWVGEENMLCDAAVQSALRAARMVQENKSAKHAA